MEKSMKRNTQAAVNINLTLVYRMIAWVHATPGCKSHTVCVALGVSKSTLFRLLATAEKNLGVVITGSRGPNGGLTLKTTGLLSLQSVLHYSK